VSTRLESAGRDMAIALLASGRSLDDARAALAAAVWSDTSWLPPPAHRGDRILRARVALFLRLVRRCEAWERGEAWATPSGMQADGAAGAIVNTIAEETVRAMRIRMEAIDAALGALLDRHGIDAVSRFVLASCAQGGLTGMWDELRDGAQGPPVWRLWWERTGEYQWTMRSAWLVDLEALGSPPAESADQ
jgi:hypothetical protein